MTPQTQKIKELRVNKGWFKKGHKVFSRRGAKQTEEAKRKMSIAKMGHVPWNKGKKGIMPTPWNKGTKGLVKPNSGTFGNGHKPPNWKYGVSLKRGYRSFIYRRRLIRKLNNGGCHTLGEWETLKAQYNWTCPACKKFEPEIILTEDHIVPSSIGGSDNIENIQPLCRSCNSKKKIKVIKYDPPTISNP